MEAMVAMRWTGLRIGCLSLGLLFAELAAYPLNAQEPNSPAGPAKTLTAALQSLAGRAAVVFAGQVVSISRRGGVVEIGFQVEQAVAGFAGTSFTLREWAGLWPPGQFRYIVGQRALVFVHGASAAGFASPVDGANGVIPVVVQGANAPELLDIRRLSAAVLRSPGTPLPTAADGAIQLSDAVAVITEALQPAAASPLRRLLPPARLPLPLRGAPVQSASASLGGATQSVLPPVTETFQAEAGYAAR